MLQGISPTVMANVLNYGKSMDHLNLLAMGWLATQLFYRDRFDIK